MTTTRRYRFLSKFQNGKLYALCGYEKESEKDMALLTVYYLFPLSSLLLLLLLSSLVMMIITNILAPYEAILSFEKITLKHGKIKTFKRVV